MCIEKSLLFGQISAIIVSHCCTLHVVWQIEEVGLVIIMGVAVHLLSLEDTTVHRIFEEMLARYYFQPHFPPKNVSER